jgi:hypothetical protein
MCSGREILRLAGASRRPGERLTMKIPLADSRSRSRTMMRPHLGGVRAVPALERLNRAVLARRSLEVRSDFARRGHRDLLPGALCQRYGAQKGKKRELKRGLHGEAPFCGKLIRPNCTPPSRSRERMAVSAAKRERSVPVRALTEKGSKFAAAYLPDQP